MVEVLRAEAASHPSRGAWIEMNATIDKTGKLTSHPSRGAWIEIFEWRTCWPMKRVAPLTGCVD